MFSEIEFTNCKRIMGKAYNGANGKKIAIEYNGTHYMLKFPMSAETKLTEISYTNSCISEYIASSVFNLAGIKAQETLLGTFEVKGKVKIVCACKDFTTPVEGRSRKILYDFCSIKNTIIDSVHGGSGTELTDILDTIERQQFVNPEQLLKHFWDVFVMDALLGNFDRHNGNWGFLYDENNGDSEITPVFDCGSCLLPQADEAVMQKVLENEDDLNARVFQFPTSAIKLNGKKINYYDFISSMEFKECNEALTRILPQINLQKICNFIENVPYISEIQKSFYKNYIMARFEKILLPAYRNVIP